MKFGANTMIWEWPFTTESLALLPKIKRMGFDAAEFTIDKPTDLDYTVAREAFAKTGLEPLVCAILSFEHDLINDDRSVREAGKDYLKHCIDAVVAVGGTHVSGPIYAAVGRKELWSDEEKARLWDMCAEGLSEVAGYAAARGVVLGLEPLNRFETSFINTAEQAVRMVQMVNSPALGVHLDTFQMNPEEKSEADAIELAGKYLVNFHACENDRGIPGSGSIPWQSIAKALKKVNYDHFVVIETFVTAIKGITGAAIWRPLAPSQDAVAEVGLQFLKGLFAPFE